jgi:hypothetical protein
MPWQLTVPANNEIVADCCNQHDFHEADCETELDVIGIAFATIRIRQNCSDFITNARFLRECDEGSRVKIGLARRLETRATTKSLFGIKVTPPQRP